MLEPVDPRDLFDDVDLARHVERAPARREHPQLVALALDLEAQAVEDRGAPVGSDVDAGHGAHPAGAQDDPLAYRDITAQVDRIRCLCRARELDEHARCGAVRDRRQRGVDALLEAVRGLGADAEPSCRAEDRSALERGRLEHDLSDRVRDLGVGASHHAGDARRAAGMRDHERLRIEHATLVVERRQRLARACAPRDQGVPGEAFAIVRVQRLAEVVRDVVRDIDDVGDRPDAHTVQPCLQPEGRRRNRDTGQDAGREARAQVRVVDRDLDELARRGTRRDGFALVEGTQPQLEQRGGIARDPAHREQVRAVREDLEVEHHVAQREA